MHHRFEAYRAFLSILTGMLVADCISKFGDITAAIRSLYAFDKTGGGSWAPALLAVLVIVYIWKNAHGMLVTMFDRAYYAQLARTRCRAFVGCLLMGLVIVSLSLVVRASAFVPYGLDVFGRGWRLLLIAFVPSLLLLAFDIFALALYGRTGRGRIREWWHSLRSIWSEVRSPPAQRDSPEEYRRIWIAEDIASMVVLGIWVVVVAWCVDAPRVEIRVTVVAFFILLVLNSVVDYWLNFNFFFSFLSKNGEADTGEGNTE